jgi:hypothetical protein
MASAPPTAQERGPPSPLSRGGMKEHPLFDIVDREPEGGGVQAFFAIAAKAPDARLSGTPC